MDPKSTSSRSQKIEKYMVDPAVVAGKTKGIPVQTEKASLGLRSNFINPKLLEKDRLNYQEFNTELRRLERIVRDNSLSNEDRMQANKQMQMLYNIYENQPQINEKTLAEMSYRAGIPRDFNEAFNKSAKVGLVDAFTVGTGLASKIPYVGEDIRPYHERLVAENEMTSRQVDEYYPDVDNAWGAAAVQGAVRFPKMWSRVAQEVYSPVSKVTAPASVVAKFPRLANLINTYGVDAVNAAWHASRGGSKGGAEGALVSSTGQLIGEKGIEPLAEAAIARFLPRFSKAAQAASGAGNVGGMASEELYYAGKNAFAPETR